VLETLMATFGMLIAVRVFEMRDVAKATFLAATSGGMVTSLFAVPMLLRLRSTISRTAAKVQIFSGLCMAISAAFPHSGSLFLTGLGLGIFCYSMQIPLMTQIYRMNYPERDRGRLFSITGATRASAAVCFGLAAGWLLDLDLQNYPWLLWAYTLSGVVQGLWTYSLPTPRWQPEGDASTSLWSSWRWVRLDADFRTLLISWMMMGVGNLIAASLFVEYLANPRHGINLPERQVALITCVVPVLARVVFSYPWGLIYDRFHLFAVRAALNVFFAAGVLCFYLGHGLFWWTLGMALWGMANAGGNVTWALWVTKLAPKHAVAEYMSVHTFLTGTRGLLTPFLAFAMLRWMSFPTVGLICGVAILSASAFISVRARSADAETHRRLGRAERL
jgi:hypothetical protein